MTLRAAILAGLAALALAPATGLADLADRPIGQGYEFAPYGQVNLAWQSFDDGSRTTGNIVDMSTATSRIGFHLRPQDGTNGLAFQFETGLSLRPSQATDQINTPPFWNWTRRDLRQVQFIFQGDFGTIRAGQGSMATDGIAESDLGGTVVVAKSTIPEAAGTYLFRTAAGPLSTVTIKSAFSNFDGPRLFRFRYDSPERAGVSLAASYGKEVLVSGVPNRYYDIALRYGRAFGPLEVRAALGNLYTETPTSVTFTTAGSASVLDTRTGLNLSLAAGRNSARSQPSYVYLKGGWNAKLVAAGTTKFVVETFRGRDYVTAGSASRLWGVAVIQEFDRPNLQVYAGYRSFAYDDLTPVGYRDAQTIQAGFLVRF